MKTPILLRRPRLAVAGRLITLALCWAAAADAAAPELSVRLDTTRITLGDPLRLHVRVERDAGDRTLFPDLDKELEPFVVHRASTPHVQDLASGNQSGRQLDERVYELRLFSLDADTVAAIEVPVVVASGDTIRLLSPALQVEVIGVRDAAEGDSLRAIKSPLHIAGGVPLWLVGVLAALLAAGLALLARRFLRRPAVSPAPVAPMARPPVDFVREFSRIAEMGLLQRRALKLYYTRLADVMRRFLQERLQVEALERTTAEIEADLGSGHRSGAVTLIDAELAQRVIDFLAAADLVKFARAEPDDASAQSVPEQGADIVREVEALLRERTAAETAED